MREGCGVASLAASPVLRVPRIAGNEAACAGGRRAVRLCVESSGAGPDLVLLHGWGMNASLWNAVAAALAQRFRVHKVDLPGHGESAMCSPYELDSLATAIARAAPPRATVCGWSLGGQVALRWALANPAQIHRLVLIAATPRFVRDAQWACAMDAAVLDEYAQGVDGDWHGSLLRFNRLQAHGDARAREVLRTLRELVFARGEPAPAALAAGLRILQNTDLRPDLPHVSQPVLVLHGERDSIVPPAAGEYLQRALPRATLKVLAGTAHAPLVAQPQRVAQCITEFCSGA